MSIVALLLILVLIGVVLTFLPLDPGIRRIIVAVVCILVVAWLLELFGILSFGTLGLNLRRH